MTMCDISTWLKLICPQQSCGSAPSTVATSLLLLQAAFSSLKWGRESMGADDQAPVIHVSQSGERENLSPVGQDSGRSSLSPPGH